MRMPDTFKGLIIEESLEDPGIVDDLDVIASKWSEPMQWTVHTVLVTPKDIEELADELRDGPWYMHFWNADELFIVFQKKIFRFERDDADVRQAAIEYGRSLGIPDEQLDFTTH